MQTTHAYQNLCFEERRTNVGPILFIVKIIPAFSYLSSFSMP